MFYFQYDQGYFYVIREFNDAYDVDIVDVIPFYYTKKITNWCKLADIKFPYEKNTLVYKLLAKIVMEYDDLDNILYCLSSFQKHVINGDIKLYCEEKK